MKKTTSVLLTSTYFGLLATSPLAEAISFFDPIDGQLDMGEYLAENAYGFLPVPIEKLSGMDFAFSDEDSTVYFQVGSGI